MGYCKNDVNQCVSSGVTSFLQYHVDIETDFTKFQVFQVQDIIREDDTLRGILSAR